MNMMTRLLSALPRNMLVPAVVLLAGWYGGAKYGAPDYALNAVDGMIAKGGAVIEALLGGGDEAAPSEDNGAEV